ncbi:hypothetical protein PISMIDRAFT_678343 [Pisolithus microcarpus 441]|uniref:Uncharacterized protein n=1 Tax=Pisolithus microcarpus 441 TaxID=765257 RepID=A0A0C9Z5T5_9AGAM|nr:hypothetical protein PISMIDRAFT_678343 [Pisolithus microcarpus 441]
MTIFFTEYFYYKDGRWYYAGTYRAFRMNDIKERTIRSTHPIKDFHRGLLYEMDIEPDPFPFLRCSSILHSQAKDQVADATSCINLESPSDSQIGLQSQHHTHAVVRIRRQENCSSVPDHSIFFLC